VTVGGALKLGTTSPMSLSASGTTLLLSGGLSAAGGISATELNVTGVVNIGSDTRLYRGAAGQLRTDNDLLVTGSVRLPGATLFGGNTQYTFARPTSTSSAIGATTFLLGQTGSGVSLRGGDLVLDGGSGSTAGQLRLGVHSDSVLVRFRLRFFFVG
jgi:hypothetical protein